MKKKVVGSWDCRNENHREDFETCPFCGTEYSIKRWDKQAVILVTDIVMGKHGYLAIVAECPKCFEKSWIHHSFLYEYSDFPKKWIKASSEERGKRELKALRDWKRGLCGACKNLESGTVTTTTRSYCKGRSGGVETKCKNYDPIRGE